MWQTQKKTFKETLYSLFCYSSSAARENNLLGFVLLIGGEGGLVMGWLRDAWAGRNKQLKK